MSETTKPTRRRVVLTGISTRAWEHPADRGALVALRKLHGFDTIIRRLSAFINERFVRMSLLGSAVRVSPRQFPRVHRLLAEAGTALDASQLPETFVVASPMLNAATIGIDTPKIVIDSALLDLLDDDELRFVLGHELGHALSGHALYQTLLTSLIQVGTGLTGAIPFGFIGMRAIIAGLSEWSRKAELSSDRAGLLATQDVAAAIRVLMKLASGGHLEDLDQAEFLAQAHEHEASEDLRDSVAKLMLLENATHPFVVMRAGQLRRWVDSGAYASVLEGDYPRRASDGASSVSDEAKAAAESYAAQFRSSEDALAKLVRDLGDGVGGFANWVGNKFRPPTQ